MEEPRKQVGFWKSLAQAKCKVSWDKIGKSLSESSVHWVSTAGALEEDSPGVSFCKYMPGLNHLVYLRSLHFQIGTIIVAIY